MSEPRSPSAHKRREAILLAAGTAVIVLVIAGGLYALGESRRSSDQTLELPSPSKPVLEPLRIPEEVQVARVQKDDPRDADAPSEPSVPAEPSEPSEPSDTEETTAGANIDTGANEGEEPEAVEQPDAAEESAETEEPEAAEETAILARARNTLKSGNAVRCLAILDGYNERFPNGLRQAEATEVYIAALCKAGRVDDAKKAASAFLRVFKEPGLRAKVKASCGTKL